MSGARVSEVEELRRPIHTMHFLCLQGRRLASSKVTCKLISHKSMSWRAKFHSTCSFR